MNGEARIASSRTTVTVSPTPWGSAALGADGSLAEGDRRWAAELQKVDEAVAGGDAATMLRAWHLACLEALGSQRWQPMVDAGDAALCIGRSTGFAVAFAAKARQAYHVALYRAHKVASVDGVLRAAAGFAGLGDREAVEHSVALGVGLMERSGDREARARASEMTNVLIACRQPQPPAPAPIG